MQAIFPGEGRGLDFRKKACTMSHIPAVMGIRRHNVLNLSSLKERGLSFKVGNQRLGATIKADRL